MHKLLFMGLLACSLNLTGQEKKLNLGIEAGPTYTSLWGNTALEQNTQPTFNYLIGLQFQYHVNWNFSLYGGLQYGRIASTTDIELRNQNNVLLGNTSLNYNLDFLTVPITARYYFGAKSQFFVEAGVTYSRLLQVESVREATGNLPEDRQDLRNDFHNINYGWCAGFGFVYPISEDLFLSIGLRHDYGISNLSIAPIVDEGSIRTNSSQVLLGINYQFGDRIH